jgi:hypothetical protein
MSERLQHIKEASFGLFYQSEGDYPFEPLSIDAAASLEDTLQALPEKEEQTPLKAVSLEQFFRNMTTPHPNASPEQQQTAQRFINLQQVLKEELRDVAVYLVGEIEVDAFILGRTHDGNYAGLRTKVIQT